MSTFLCLQFDDVSDETARAAETARLGMTLDEARQILNISNLENLDTAQVEQVLLLSFR